MENWQKTKIGDFLFEREGRYKPDNEVISGLKRIDKIDFSGNFHIAQKPSKTNMILVCSGDLVISGINVSKGAMGIYHGDEDVTATIHYSSYTFDTSKIDLEYFKRFLKSAEFIRLLQEQVKGGIKTEIKPKHLLPLEIDLPDIEEQRKILSHFKSVETEDGELKQELTHQQTLLKKLRQQILQEAIEGKLTADWRAENPDVEPAYELLERIRAEKAQLIKDKKIKKQKPLPPIREEEKPFELPVGWVWCRIEQIIDNKKYALKAGPFGSSLTKSTYVESGYKVYGQEQVIKQNPHYGNYYISEDKYNELLSCAVAPDDLLLSLVGTIGKLLILPKDIKSGIINPRLIKITLHRKVDKKYFSLLYSTLFVQKQLKSNASGQTMDVVSIKTLKKLYLPLPPLPEQKAIAAKVEKLLTLCDQLETQIASNQSHSEQLMHAVLKEAFTQTSEQKRAGNRSCVMKVPNTATKNANITITCTRPVKN